MSTVVVTGAAVTEAVRSAGERGDPETARAIFAGSVDDETILAISAGVLEVRGDSRAGFTIECTRTPKDPSP